MNKPGKVFLTALFVISFTPLFSQNRFFTDAGANVAFKTTGKRVITPEKFRSSVLDIQAMKNFLWSLPSEKNINGRQQTPIVELPMPDGTMARFHIWESPIMEPALAAKYPEIKTFEGQGIDDPYATVRLDLNPYFGFNAQILSVNGNAYIDPYARGDVNNYESYYASDNKRNPDFKCATVQNINTNPALLNRVESICKGTQL
ncbi:MAG TPA: hypothetical protein VG676_10665, partial [Chitinophagaceae bacterium]|nr:hypothetical protein [Chitinophagaceae bacterium]